MIAIILCIYHCRTEVLCYVLLCNLFRLICASTEADKLELCVILFYRDCNARVVPTAYTAKGASLSVRWTLPCSQMITWPLCSVIYHRRWLNVLAECLMIRAWITWWTMIHYHSGTASRPLLKGWYEKLLVVCSPPLSSCSPLPSLHPTSMALYRPLTGGNWQKWKRVFLTCPCHEIYRDEAVGLKNCKNTWKITIFVKMWNLGQYRENLIFCQ